MGLENSAIITTATIFHAIIGIIRVKGEPFLLLISQIHDAGSIYPDRVSNIFKIKDVFCFSFRYGSDQSKLTSETKTIIGGITELLQQGFYFSSHYDLSTSMQRTSKTEKLNKSLFDIADKAYVWNNTMIHDFINQGINTSWLTPIIQGYVGNTQENINGKKLRIVLISRRRHAFAGTRFNCRGIDDDGNVANMVETEQIVFFNGLVYSHTQIRGSVPVFWSQTGVSSINLTRVPEMSFPAFCKHFDELSKLNKRVLIFNLLSSVPHEALLTKAYESNAAAYEKKRSTIKYCYFDFNQECANSVKRIHIVSRDLYQLKGLLCNGKK